MSVARKLLAWYRRHKRDLPWRHTRDPYSLFISELMLQQTQVDRVLPKYHAWINALPSWKKLADASTRQLLTLWAGLGYNRRAIFAREVARDIVQHGVPKDVAGWRRLKGIGPYMAAALTEFVNHKRALVIETNIRRVAGRALLGIPFPRLSDDPRILHALDRILPHQGPHWDVPQALMDIGSLLCAPKLPRCELCPLKTECRARDLFLPQKLEKTLRRHRNHSRVIETRHAGKKYPDRIYRGRLLAWVRIHGPMQTTSLGSHIDETYTQRADLSWIRQMLSRLVKDGLLVYIQKDTVSLPQT